MPFYYVSISPSSTGFPEYQCVVNDESWDDKNDLLLEIEADGHSVHCINDVDVEPDGVEDIRGRIHSEPDSVYAIYDNDHPVSYFGILEK